jgi:hypothetical protein
MTITAGTVHLVLPARTVAHLVALSVRRDAEGAAVARRRALELALEALVGVAVGLVAVVVARGATVVVFAHCN